MYRLEEVNLGMEGVFNTLRHVGGVSRIVVAITNQLVNHSAIILLHAVLDILLQGPGASWSNLARFTVSLRSSVDEWCINVAVKHLESEA